MRTLTHLSVCSLLPLLFAPAPLNAEGIPAKTLKDVKAASVYIKVEVSSFLAPGKVIPLTGSGFLLHVADGAGFIATNNHVVSPLPGGTPRGHPKVVFHSGTPNEKNRRGPDRRQRSVPALGLKQAKAGRAKSRSRPCC